MQLAVHSQVLEDLQEIAAYYLRSGSRGIVQDFYDDLEWAFSEVREKPRSFSIRAGKLSRANLKKFPYHIVFKIDGEIVRVLVLRHHRRHPGFGTRRRWN